jgi:hypothetical protein
VPEQSARSALAAQGDLRRLHEALDGSFVLLMEEARAEGYQQALLDVSTALRQGLPALELLLRTKMPPRPPGSEVEPARRTRSLPAREAVVAAWNAFKPDSSMIDVVTAVTPYIRAQVIRELRDAASEEGPQSAYWLAADYLERK